MDAAQEDRLRELEERASGVLSEAEAFELENLRTTRLLETTGSAPDNGEYLEHTIDYGYHPRPMSEEAEMRFRLAKAQRWPEKTGARCPTCGASSSVGGVWGWLLAWLRTGGKR